MNIEDFWSKVEKTESGCWLWVGKVDKDGYGTIHYGKYRRAHRLSYELLKGNIPEGLVIDHLCRNRACVNPTHLEPVTNHENLMRGSTIAANNLQKTHCRNGHLLAGDNLDRGKQNKGWRLCKTCRREYDRKWYAQRKQRLLLESFGQGKLVKA